MFDINNNYEYNLYLCDIDKTIIGAIDYIDINYTQNFRQYDELSFEVPLTNNGWMQVENKYFNYLQPLYLILMEVKNNDDLVFKEFFIVDSPNFSYDEGITKKNIKCYSSDYEFNNRYLNSYEEVKVLYDVDNSYGGGILNVMFSQMENTWSINHISNSLIGVYHSYNYSSNTFRSIIEDLEEQFNCYFIFDTTTNQINIFTPEEVGESTEIIISDENFLKSLSCDIKNAEMVTKLKIFGKDNCTIAKYNPSGQLYILNFDWFQENGRMPNDLSTAYTNYKNLVASKEGEFQGYIDQLEILQTSLNTKNAELNILEISLEAIEEVLDALIDTDRRNTGSYDDAYDEKLSIKSSILTKENEIDSLKSQITVVNSNISILNNLLTLSNNFSSAQLKILSKFTIEEKLSLDTVSNELQLYTYGKAYMQIKSKPSIDMDLNVIDLFSVDDDYLISKYSKIKVGNFIYLDCSSLGFNYDEYRIVKISHSKLSNSLTITISNKDKINSELNYLNRIFTASAKAADDIETNKPDYSSYLRDKDNIIYRRDTIDTAETPIKLNTNYINQRGFLGNSLGTRNGAIKIQGDQIVFSPDGNFRDYYAILSPDGLYLETEDVTKRCIISVENGFQIDLWNTELNSWKNAIYLGTTGGVPSLHIDNGYISLTRIIDSVERNKINLDPEYGIKIIANTGTALLPVWEDRMFLSNEGYLIAKQLRTSSDTNNYITLEDQFINFWNSGLKKIQLGFQDAGSGTYNPYMVWGVGDGTGGDIGFIVKEPTKFTVRHRTSNDFTNSIDFVNNDATYIGGGIIVSGAVLDCSGIGFVLRASSSRPTSVLKGHMMFDTDLNVPIWYDGTDWVDANGIIV